ncbi:bifunctional metallophosphatase/5'-nucleotidase [Nitrospira sp. Kam-Ns4a]
MSPLKLLRLALAACLLWGGLPTAALPETLTILHSSEHHGAALPFGPRGQPKVGGLARRATLVEAVRHQADAVLLVDSGDILIGTALSSFFRGEPDIQAMNLMRYQAMAAGNHDFDFGLDHLRRLQEWATFPILCSNVGGKTTALPCKAFAVVRAGPFTVGVIGLLGRSNFPDTFNREVVKLLEFRDPVDTVRRLAGILRVEHKADLVIAITHQGTEEDRALLTQAPELAAIIGGHTEGFDGLLTAGAAAPAADATRPGPVLVKTHRQGRTLGRLDLTLERQAAGGEGGAARWTVARAVATNLPVTPEVEPHPQVRALLDNFAKRLDALAGTVVGKAAVRLEGASPEVRTKETNLGNLLADLLRAEYGTDVALVNGGQIRDSIPAGPVEAKHVLQVLPFDSPAVTFSITGEQLRLALEHSVAQLPKADGRFLQVSGLAVTYDLTQPPGARARVVTVRGRPLEPTRRYTVATDAFLADGGDGFTMFADARDRIERQTPLRDLLLNALRTRPLNAAIDGRIRFTGQ